MIHWTPIESFQTLENLHNISEQELVLIYKHSTRCSLCINVLEYLEQNWKDSKNTMIKPYFLDLLQYREISNAIEQNYEVLHESPQVLLISKGKCIYHDSHKRISVEKIMDFVPNLTA